MSFYTFIPTYFSNRSRKTKKTISDNYIFVKSASLFPQMGSVCVCAHARMRTHAYLCVYLKKIGGKEPILTMATRPSFLLCLVYIFYAHYQVADFQHVHFVFDD